MKRVEEWNRICRLYGDEIYSNDIYLWCGCSSMLDLFIDPSQVSGNMEGVHEQLVAEYFGLDDE